MKILIFFYLSAFVAANLIVKHFGAHGLWFSSFFLIPFDFVARCIIHEKYKGAKLIIILSCLTAAASLITWAMNAPFIALASMSGFTAAQISAGVFYQLNKKNSSWFYKVNVSDLIAIIFDSFVFQLIAFGILDLYVTAGQIIIKFAGGLLWYYILFKKLKLNEKINRI